MLMRSGRWGSDIIIADLEDAVLPRDKPAARQIVRDWLLSSPEGTCDIWVRVNPGEQGDEDLAAIAGLDRVTTVCAAKVETVADVERISTTLRALGSQCRVVPLLESAAALFAAEDIAKAPNVVGLQLGEADLRAELGIEPGEDEEELLLPRSLIVFASCAAGLASPLAPVSTDFRDIERFTRSSRRLKRLGFVGRACIHPAQVQICNEVFTVSKAELEEAQSLLQDFESANDGVIVDRHGRMVDEAVVKRARRLLLQAQIADSPPGKDPDRLERSGLGGTS